MPGTSNVERQAGDPPGPVTDEQRAKVDEQRAKVDELRRRLAEVERERDAMLRTPEDGAPAGWDRIEGGAEATDAQPPTDRRRVPGAFYPPAGVQVTVDAEHLLKDAPVPPDWTTAAVFDDDDEADPGADADRELERMDLDNTRRALDLQERELALDERREGRLLLAGGEALRLAALTTAREVAAGYQYMSPTEQGRAVEARYRQFLGLLEETAEPDGDL